MQLEALIVVVAALLGIAGMITLLVSWFRTWVEAERLRKLLEQTRRDVIELRFELKQHRRPHLDI